MFGNNDFNKKKDPLVDAVAKVMQENQLRRDIEKQFQEEIGIQAKRELPFQQHAEYDRVLSERTVIALNEELKGNQHKIDANKNNKVDAQDFKILKAKKGLAEADFPPGAGKDTAKDKDPDMMKAAPGGKDETPKAAPMPPKRPTNMEEAEQIDELSKKTLGSYVKKASHDVATKSAATGRYAERANKEEDDRKKTGDYSGYRQGRKDNETADKMFGKSWKRRQGIAKAVDKMTKEETINEISDKVKAAYARKADKEVTRTNTMGVAKRTGGVGIEDAKRKMDNRKAGIKRSMSEEGLGIYADSMIARGEAEKKAQQERDAPIIKAAFDQLRAKKMTVNEKAPPGDKYERMVKHIKSKYSKGGLTDKEKSIAYATAQKAKNKDLE
jgi:hypothetical protein